MHAVVGFARGLVVLLLVFLVAVVAHAAEPPTNVHPSESQNQDWRVEGSLPQKDVHMISQRPDGVLVLATSSGLSTFDGQRFQSLPIEIDGHTDKVAVNAMLYGRDNDLWIGTDGHGVLHHTSSGTENISERAGRFNERVRMLYQDAQGVLWIATQNGVRRFINGRMEILPEAGMISDDIVAPIAEDGRGGMFFVTSFGLFHWQGGIVRQVPPGTPAAKSPVAIYRDPQYRVWLGTTTGVLQLVPRKNGAQGPSDQFAMVTRASVPSPVTAMVGDAAGNLWVGTRSDGILRLGPDGVSHWSSRNGLPDDAVRSLFVDNEQNLWIGMLTGGLSRWRNGALAPYGKPEGFHATFAANTLADNHDLADNHGDPAATPAILQRSHFYQTWYFYLTVALLAAAVAVQLFRRRVQLMKGRIGIVLEERNRIACEYHDTLMAGFAAISWQLEATAKLFQDTDSAATPAAKSCELARSMVSHCQAEARRIIWDLRDTEEVTNILSQALYRTLASSHIQGAIETTLDVGGEEVALSPGCVHHLVCIGQEAVSNAIRHAQPSHISVHLKYETNALQLTIRDDGRGFHAADRSASRRGHFGIPVMEERARKLGGTLHLQTSVGVGTEVTVRVSFNAMRKPVNQEHHVIRWIGI